jgi:spore maturation protein CgeB
MHSSTYKIAFYGSSLVSAYWNGAATYYRGIISALHRLGHHTTFFEPDAFGRQQHRDMPDPDWADVVVYQPTEEDARRVLKQACDYDIVVKASGVGVFDELLEQEVIRNRKAGQQIIFWDVDAPATLARMKADPEDSLRKLISDYDLILTYGGGPPVVEAYTELGARQCVPINNALDPDTHHPANRNDERFKSDLAFLGNRLPDREERMDEFFFATAEALPEYRFLLGGNGWEDKEMPANVRYLGHVYTKDHNAFNSTPTAVLNINRQSMAETGYSPATRVFEAAGAGACLITDYWEGIELFLEPGKEVLVVHNERELIKLLKDLSPQQARSVGQSALERVLSGHTYRHRARKLIQVLDESFSTSNSLTL